MTTYDKDDFLYGLELGEIDTEVIYEAYDGKPLLLLVTM